MCDIHKSWLSKSDRNGVVLFSFLKLQQVARGSCSLSRWVIINHTHIQLSNILQESKLYYDAELGCFYEYDYENKKYTVHSRVKLPDTEDREERKPKDVGTISSSEEEYLSE